MLNLLSLCSSRSVDRPHRWEELRFAPRSGGWTRVRKARGLMAFRVVENNPIAGWVLAMVVMQDGQAPGVIFPMGTLLLGLHGQLHTLDNTPKMVILDPGDLLVVDGGVQSPAARDFYVGLWYFPHGNPLQQMVTGST